MVVRVGCRDVVVLRKQMGRCFFFFFNDTATAGIYTLSLHDALPILPLHRRRDAVGPMGGRRVAGRCALSLSAGPETSQIGRAHV